MRKILVINGPNLNMLGIREPEIYGHTTYAELEGKIRTWASELGVDVKLFQSNHEGAIIDEIQAAYGRFDGIIINPGTDDYYVPRQVILQLLNDDLVNTDFAEATRYAFPIE
jgi:3-dehydroquinate dehydratase-2